jgi:recombination protein RecT
MTTENQTSTVVAPPPAQPPAVKPPSAKKTFEQLIESDQFKKQIAAALPKHLTPERFIRVLMTATIRAPLLLQCTQESMFKAIFDCAAAGLELDGRRAHLIPFKNTKKGVYEAQLIVDYRGIAELVMRSGVVSNIHADIVCENDKFEVDRGQITTHTVDYKNERGKMYAAYVIIRMRDGGEKSEVMNKQEIDAIRRRSKSSGDGPWVTDYNEMAKKTVFKRASKWVPLSPEIRDAVEADNDAIDIPSIPILPEIRRPIFGKKPEALTDETQPDAAPVEAVPVEPEPAPEPTPEEDPQARKTTIDLIESALFDIEKSETNALGYARAQGWTVPPDAKALKALPLETLEKLLAWVSEQRGGK